MSTPFDSVDWFAEILAHIRALNDDRHQIASIVPGQVDHAVERFGAAGLSVYATGDEAPVRREDETDADILVYRRICLAVIRPRVADAFFAARDADRSLRSSFYSVRPEGIVASPELLHTLRTFGPLTLARLIALHEGDRRLIGAQGTIPWNLAIIGVTGQPGQLTGAGVRVALLDEGVLGTHVDLRWSIDKGLTIGKSLVPGDHPWDRQITNHATACAGIIAGPFGNPDGRRYGVAPGAALRIARVIDGHLCGADRHVVAGIEWALEQDCRVVSMSLASTSTDAVYYDHVAERCMELGSRGAVLVAAVGQSNPPRAPIDYPAASERILGVGGFLKSHTSYPSGKLGSATDGFEVNLAAPSDLIFTSSDAPGGYGLYGHGETSVATPHVAGALALLAQKHPETPVKSLWDELLAKCVDPQYQLPPEQGGLGLVSVPTP